MEFPLRIASLEDVPRIRELIAASVRGLQPEYSEAQREAALESVFTVDTQLIADGGHFLAEAEGELAGCGGWSYRGKLCGGDAHRASGTAALLDPASDAAKIRAIFVHPKFARRGLGRLLLRAAEEAAVTAGFHRFEMGSTLAGVSLYRLEGYYEVEREQLTVGVSQAEREATVGTGDAPPDEAIEIVRMAKRAKE